MDPGRRIAQACDIFVDLVAGQLSALAGLRSLRHFDLQFSRIHEIVGGDAEAGGGHLLDIAEFLESPFGNGANRSGSSPPSPVLLFRADAVHRDRQRLVRFLADRAERHRARRKAFDDLLGGLDFLDRNRRLGAN